LKSDVMNKNFIRN